MLKLTPRECAVSDWQRPEDISPVLHRLLRLRGVGSEAEARAYLRPNVSQLRDPNLLSDMAAAVAIINAAVQAGERICVYGDYDVDGVCACAILAGYLKDIGASAEAYLPSRHTEGYGLNDAAIRAIAQKFELLITVDCGVTANGCVALAKELGLKTIVTDHHRPEGALPDCPVVNPLLNDYPFPYLCGAGVAFQLVSALGGRERALEYVDYAALATIADIVPLLDENRAIAYIGLKKINARPRPGLRALIDASGISGKVLSAGNIAFQITPRLNASGRMGDATRAYDLITCSDIDKCITLAAELNEENARRKSLEQRVISEAERMLTGFDFPSHRAIIVAGEGWNHGVIGLAASRLAEKYNYPTIVLAKDGDVLTGSCRSIEAVDIHEALTGAAEHLIQFGGHRMAAGLTLRYGRLKAFTRALDEYLFKNIDAEAYVPRVEYDVLVNPGELTPEIVNALDALSPTGCQNPPPMFRMPCEVAHARPVGANGAHLKLTLRGGSSAMDGIWFRKGGMARDIEQEGDALFTATISDYQGRVTVQADMRAFAPRGWNARLSRAEARSENLFQAFLTDAVYNCRYTGGSAREISLDELGALLKARVQGALVVASDAEGARDIMLSLAPAGLDFDLSIGAYPADPRCFRAIAVAPKGVCPPGYSVVVMADAPEGLINATHIVAGARPSRLFTRMPDIEQLRRVYAAMRKALSRPHFFCDMDSLIGGVADEADMGEVMAAAGILILKDMGLAQISAKSGGVKLNLPKTEKRDPAENELFKRMSAWRKRAKEGVNA